MTHPEGGDTGEGIGAHAGGAPDADGEGRRGADGARGASGSLIQAAGCVLWSRAAGDGALRLALVHRPKYDDWSHPKGKLKRGESALVAAVREVAEETGMHCRPGTPLPTLRYTVGTRPKEVRYWEAEATGGRFAPNDEVDAVLWLPPDLARERLTEEHDRALVDALLAVVE